MTQSLHIRRILDAVRPALWYWRYAPLLLIGLYLALPFHIAVDMQGERCLQNKSVYLQLENVVRHPKRGDLVFWHPQGPLAYVQAQYVGKRVVAVAGDYVEFDNKGIVYVNKAQVGSGFPLASMYKVTPDYFFAQSMVVPSDHVFVMGDHPQSNDSRYWGPLPVNQLKGQMWGIL